MIPYRITRIDLEPNEQLDMSKLFGSPVLPRRFMSRHRLNDDYYFAQINLEELAPFRTPLPRTGMLYIFLRFDKMDIVPRVIYTDRPPEEVLVDANEAFDDLYFPDALQLHVGEGEDGYMLGDFDQAVPEADRDDYVVLLKADPLGMGLDDFPTLFNPDDELYFVMDAEDLAGGRFDRVRLVGHGS